MSRTLSLGTITASTSPVFAGYSFQLEDFPDFTELTALYDQYRIRQASVNFLHNGAALVGGQLFSVIDYDDATPPTTLASLWQYPSLMITAAGTNATRNFTPHCVSVLYDGVTPLAAGGNIVAPWIDSNNPSVPHYGLKVGVQGYASATAIWNVYLTAIINFRNTI